MVSIFGVSGLQMTLGVSKKLSLQSKCKKKSKSLFCIINDIGSCLNRQKKTVCSDRDDSLADEIDAHSTKNPFEGLENLLGEAGHNMDTFVANMEHVIRLGNYQARLHMQKLLPVQCFVRNYSRLFNVLGDRIEQSEYNVYMSIEMLPEINILLHQCMMPTNQYEDDLVILIRSCIPFFQNPRRVKHDHAWPEQNDQTLCILLKWCLPSLLSLYPETCVKDVNFMVRLGIMRLFRELLVGTFAARNSFYIKNKTLIKMCLMEYIYYIIQHVNALPNTRYMRTVNVGVMATNIFNIGQQFRVELNLEFSKSAQGIDSTAIMALFRDLQPKCHIMFERCCRYNKSSMMCSYSEMYNTRVVSSKKVSRIKKVSDDLAALCFPLLSSIPYTRFFSVFEMHCRRNRIPSTHTNMLWDNMKLIQVHEVSVALVEAQTQVLRQKWDSNDIQMHRQSTLLVCMFCAQKNIFPTFRHDVRQNEFACNRCNMHKSVFEIDLIGRIVVVCNIPIVFSLCCQKIVILSGRGTEICCSNPKTHSHTCSCIPWDKHTTTLNFSQILSSISISQHISHFTEPVVKTWPVATREYIQARIEGSVQKICIKPQSRNSCCMCRINAVQNRYTLLDIYNNSMVIVPVCTKHSLFQHVIPLVLTVNEYIQAAQARLNRNAL